MVKAGRFMLLSLLGAVASLSRAGAQANPLIQSVLARVAADSIIATVSELSGKVPVLIDGRMDTIRSRQYNTQGNEKAFIYLRNRLKGYGLDVDSQAYSATGKNLFGIVRGKSDASKVIIIGAHYDDAGLLIGPGADDNASGVAGVLECARLCAGGSFAYTLMFAFWDEEEMASTGSMAYVQGFPATSKTMLGCINMDMIGWDGNGDSVAEIHSRYSAASPSWAAKAISVNADYEIGLQTQLVSPGNGASDHASFWNSYQTAIGINEDYDGDMNPSWHQASDTVGKLNGAYAAKITRLALGTALSYANIQPAGILTSAVTGGFQVSPNPFAENIEVVTTSPPPGNPTLVLTDVEGRICATQSWQAGCREAMMNTVSLPPGAYILTIYAATGKMLQSQRLAKVSGQ